MSTSLRKPKRRGPPTPLALMAGAAASLVLSVAVSLTVMPVPWGSPDLSPLPSPAICRHPQPDSQKPKVREDHLPADTDPARIMKLGKSPGLGVRLLHAAGVTGKGVGVAIIDQALLTDHEEYAGRLRVYEEMNVPLKASTHASAVTSIAVGEKVGVAPGADLYLIAAYSDDASAVAPAIDRIIEINQSLPADRKIRVLSMPFTYDLGGYDHLHHGDILQAAQRAREAGIFILSCEQEDRQFVFDGLGRDPLADPEKTVSYGPAAWIALRIAEGEPCPGSADVLLVPMDSRCTASSTGTSDFVFHREGSLTWTPPYLAGLYALACQVRPDLTPEVFWSAALETGHLLEATREDGERDVLGRTVDPVALIDELTGRRVVPGWMYLFPKPTASRAVGVAVALAGLALAAYLALLAVRRWPKAPKLAPADEGAKAAEATERGRRLGDKDGSMTLAPGKRPQRLALLAMAVVGALILSVLTWFVAVRVREGGGPTVTVTTPGAMDVVPAYDPDSEDYWQVELRSFNVSRYDLTGRAYDLLHANFDSRTKWPDKLPEPFDPDRITELGKNPGLGVRRLHAAGITGEGVGVAIIDQPLLTDHEEYVDRLKLYEEMPNAWSEVAMHGPAVSSIALGKTVGVAPEADLYFINACASDASGIAPAIDRFVEVNRSLPADRKIRVLSMSFSYDLAGTDPLHHDDILRAAQRARQAGLLVLSCEPDDRPFKFAGLARDPLADPEDTLSYSLPRWHMPLFRGEEASIADTLLVPMDSRCTAGRTGTSDYVFYREGGWSWATPYIAGLYALVCQVRPGITPEVFWSAALETGHPLEVALNDWTRVTAGRIVDPVALIEKLTGRDIVPGSAE